MGKLKALLLLIIAMLAAAGGWLYYFAHRPLELPQSPFTFSLEPGSSVKSVSRRLVEAGLLSEPWTFVVLARALGKSAQIKAGDYELSETLTPLDLIELLIKGRAAANISVQFIEGHTFAQIRMVLDEHPALKHDTKGLSDREVLQLAGAEETHPEGLFFPDTYLVNPGVSDVTVLRLAHKTMKSHLAKSWETRDPNVQYATPYEALIMASIVEKETGSHAERPLIAAVFINRLKRNMKLQTDPSVIYGLGSRFDGNLRKQDLLTDTPYNTYTRVGLPPTPIAMPGLASIMATLNPAPSQALYFVARGDGTHEFSASLAEHNRAVAKYQK